MFLVDPHLHFICFVYDLLLPVILLRATFFTIERVRFFQVAGVFILYVLVLSDFFIGGQFWIGWI
jgi:hypothetical protein